MCFTLGVNRSLRTCAIVAALSSYVGVGLGCGTPIDDNMSRYTTVRFFVWNSDLTSASFVLAATSGCLTPCEENTTFPHLWTELEVDRRSRTSLARSASAHASMPIVFDFCVVFTSASP